MTAVLPRPRGQTAGTRLLSGYVERVAALAEVFAMSEQDMHVLCRPWPTLRH
ncbi:hypothetical protein [Dankookia sp. P2]|uniref:hypothetical protein n=1 Tax=Dankookia sp. P2 TaxID=3423955 RepID=UPI003D679AD4